MTRKDILNVIIQWTAHNYWPEIMNMDGNKSLRVLNITTVSQHM